MNEQVFINLPVKNLDKTIDFFTQLGYEFDAQFTNENATCMIVNDAISVMLLVEPFFQTFMKKEVCDTARSAEMILALTVESRAEVDAYMDKVLRAGGKEPREATDHGWMYQRSFEDINGHLWEVFWMDPNGVPEE